MNTLPRYLPFSHTQRIFFHFSLFVAFIFICSVTCLKARQAYLGTSLYLTKHHCYTSLYLVLAIWYQMTIKYSAVCSVQCSIVWYNVVSCIKDENSFVYSTLHSIGYKGTYGHLFCSFPFSFIFFFWILVSFFKEKKRTCGSRKHYYY